MAALQVLDGELWQWDTGREVEVVGCEQVHFAKSTTGTCYTVAVDDSKAKIPDELLQAAGRVYAWAYITDEAYGGRTRIEALWDVKRRAKPAEYIYEPSDQRTIKDAETARDEAKAAQKAAEAARDKAVAAEVKGARATTLASGSEATAAMEGNVLVVGVPKGDALRYSDLTAEQIAELKKPATDAAAGVNKVNNEFKELKASVETAEKGRADAEAVRKEKETERGQNETGRKEAESGRKTAEQKREQDSTKALADAQAALKDGSPELPVDYRLGGCRDGAGTQEGKRQDLPNAKGRCLNGRYAGNRAGNRGVRVRGPAGIGQGGMGACRRGKESGRPEGARARRLDGPLLQRERRRDGGQAQDGAGVHVPHPGGQPH